MNDRDKRCYLSNTIEVICDLCHDLLPEMMRLLLYKQKTEKYKGTTPALDPSLYIRLHDLLPRFELCAELWPDNEDIVDNVAVIKECCHTLELRYLMVVRYETIDRLYQGLAGLVPAALMIIDEMDQTYGWE